MDDPKSERPLPSAECDGDWRSVFTRRNAKDGPTFGDPVEEWKRSVRARLQSEATRGNHASVRLRVTLGFVALAVIVGAMGGPAGRGIIVVALTSVLLARAWRTIREARRESSDFHAGVDALVRETETLLSQGESIRASQLAQKGLAIAASARERQRLWKAFAWAWIGRRDPFFVHGALLNLPPTAIDVHLLASYLTICNRIDEAVELLQEARGLGHRTEETTKLLIDLLFRRGEYHATLLLARDDGGLLSDRDREAVALAVADHVHH
jgi:hypothetical protein